MHSYDHIERHTHSITVFSHTQSEGKKQTLLQPNVFLTGALFTGNKQRAAAFIPAPTTAKVNDKLCSQYL